MPLSLNHSLSALEPSEIRVFNRMAAQTPGCIALTLGEPGETTPEPIRAEVTCSLQEGKTHYPPNNGTQELKEAISKYMADEGIGYDPDQIIVTSGATEACFAALMTIVNPGDEVIVPVPNFLLYGAITTIARGKFVSLDTAPDHFQIDKERLEATITPRTKAFVLASPTNPTGCILSKESLAAIAEAAEAHDFYVLVDSVYEKLVYTDEYMSFAAAYPQLKDRTIVVNSFSKPYAMTGWRLGWLAAPKELMGPLSMVHMYTISSVVSFTQDAAVKALASDVEPFRQSYQKRRDIVIKALNEMGLEVTVPEGAFYAFPSIKGLCDEEGKQLSAREFCMRGIKEVGVALVPGNCFGAEGFVRLSYATDEDTLREGLKRLATFVKKLRP